MMLQNWEFAKYGADSLKELQNEKKSFIKVKTDWISLEIRPLICKRQCPCLTMSRNVWGRFGENSHLADVRMA